MKIRRLQRWISEQLFGRPLKLATGTALVLGLGVQHADAQTTLTFQQGVNSYTGALDAWIRSDITTSNATAATISMDGGADAFQDASWAQGLIKFGDLFGTGAGKIPVGSNILTATLTVHTGTGSNDQSGNNFSIYRLTNSFDANVTWANSFGGDGVTVGIDTVANPDSTKNAGGLLDPNTGTLVSFNVRNSLQTWSSNPDAATANSANLGWLLTTAAGTDAWTIGSSDNTTAANQPVLVLQYVPGGGQDITWNTAANATGTWNTTAGNTPWLNTSSAASKFSAGDNVNFSADTVNPVAITVDTAGVAGFNINFTHNSGTYQFSGGAISGNMNKTGAGNVTLSATNNFAAVSITGGTVTTATNNPFGTLDTLTIGNNATWIATGATQSSSKDFTVGSGGATLSVGGTNSLTISGATSGTDTITKIGTGSLTFAGSSTFTGTLNINEGRVIVADPVSSTGNLGDFNATTINVASGATFQFGSTAVVANENPDLPANTAINVPTGANVDWYVGEQFGSLNLTGGALNIYRGGPDLQDAVGSNWTAGTITGAAGDVRSMNVSLASSINKQSPGTINITNTTLNAAGGIFLTEGMISTDSAITNSGLMLLGGQSTTGTLQLRTTGYQTVNKLTSLGAGGGVIDVSQATGYVTWAGNINDAGSLTKAGPGTLRLTGSGSYGGPTNINDGTLVTNNTGLSSSTTVNIANGKQLILNTPSATANISGLNIGTTSGANVKFLLDGNTTAAPLNVTGTDGLTTSTGSNVILQSSLPLTVGSFPLIGVSGTVGGSGLGGLNLVTAPRITASLVNTGAQIEVNVTSSDTIKWSGANGAAWDTTTSNWNLVGGGTSTTYLENSLSGDFVAFDDSATGSTAITLAADVKPALIAFSNSTKDYTISGTGKIIGDGQLTKSGTGIANLDVQYASTGAIKVNQGTLNINSANTFGAETTLTVNDGTLNLNGVNTLPTTLTVNNGTANFTAAQTIGSLVVTGGNVNNSTTGSAIGTLTQSNGTVTINGANQIGSAAITGGTAILTGTNTVGGITLSGGTLETRADNAMGSTGTLTISNNAILRGTTANQTTGKALTVDGSGATVQVDDAITLGITGATAGTGTITKTGTGTWAIMGTSSFTGTLDINAGTVIVQGSAAAPGNGDFNAATINVKNGGRFQFGQTTALASENPDLPANTSVNIEAGGIVDWNVGEDFGGLNLRGGTLNLLRGAPNMTSTTVDSTWTSGTINSATNLSISPGAGKIFKTGTDTVTINGANIGSTGTFGIQEGTLSTNGNFVGATGDLILGTTSTSGTLQFRNTTSFSTAKPLKIESAGGTIDVTQAGTTATFSGAIGNPASGTAGILTKTGLGRLLLSGANTSSGAFNVSQGTLAVSATGLNAASTVSVASGATFEAPATGQAVFSGLNVASGGNLLFNVSTVPTIAQLSVSTASGATLSGSSVTVQSLNGLTVGTIPLLDYNTSLGAGGLSGVTLVLPPRVVANLVDNLVDTRIDLNVTAVDFIKWQGNVSAVWDVNTTSNWKLNSNSSATTYLQPTTIGDRVVFDDSSAGNTNVTLSSTINPAQVTFDNSTATYSISGTGSIMSTGGLTKNGTGTATIATNNTFAGPTTVNAGTLVLTGNNTLAGGVTFGGGTLVVAGDTAITPTVNSGKLVIGNGGTTGAIGNTAITLGANGKLEFNRSDSTTLTNVISGTGEIIQTGSGTTTLASNSSGFTGTVTINGGTLRSAIDSGTHNFNPTSITVNNGGTYEFAGPGDANLPNSTYVTVNTGGIVNWNLGETFGGINVRGGTLNLNSGVTLSGTVANQFTSGTINGPSAFAGGTAVVKTTSGTVTINGSALNTTGGLTITEGTISTDAAISNTGMLTLGGATTRGTLQLRTATSGSVSKPTTVSAGGGVFDITQAATTITATGALTANANSTLVKAGAGGLTLTGAANYGANSQLQVDAGTLNLNHTAAPTIGTGFSASVATGATLNLGGTANPLGNNTNVTNNGTLAATTANKRVANISGTGVTQVTAANATLTASSIRQGGLTIGAGNTVTVAANGTNAGVSKVGNLNINATGKLDLLDNDLIISSGSLSRAQVEALVNSGANFGAQNGPGLVTSTAQALSTLTGLGTSTIGETVYAGSGSYGGQTVTDNDVLVKYTYRGDADLNGVVDFDDYFYIDTGFATNGNRWSQGDFDNNGVVDFDDYFYIDTAFATQSGAFLTAGLSSGVSLAAVPEPSTWVLGSLALLGLAGFQLRRGRRQLQGER